MKHKSFYLDSHNRMGTSKPLDIVLKTNRCRLFSFESSSIDEAII